MNVLSAQRPNIVWIYSDDHTMQSIGAYGGQLSALDPTPNIDRLAKGGMIFNRCHVGNSICAPARATLLTGKHSHKHGKIENYNAFNHDQQQFQKILQSHGYQTVMIGKIHLDGKMQGFDHWDVLPGQGSYYQPEFINKNGRYREEGYVTDVITDKSLDWLNRKRDPNKPFMLMVHHKGTHRTWKCAPRHTKLYDGITIPEPDTLFDDYQNRGVAAKTSDMSIRETMRLETDLKVRSKQDKKKGEYEVNKNHKLLNGEVGAYYRMNEKQKKKWDEAYDPRNVQFFNENLVDGSKEMTRWKYQRYVKDYLRTAKSIDESVGRILDHLKETGLENNTIVMYSSDQGFYLGEHGWFDKRFMYDESFRAPLIVKWPGEIEPGTINDDLVQNIDFASTFLDIAKVDIPNDMQGCSLVPLFKNLTPPDWRRSLYYHYYQYPGMHSVKRHEGVTTSRYKLIRYYGVDVPDGEEYELFDRLKDPAEMVSCYHSPEYKNIVLSLKKELHEIRVQYDVQPIEQRLR